MYVKSVKVENLKGFEKLEFDFQRPGGYAGWTVFVGGNASGKSTLLRCIALALIGPEGRALLGPQSEWDGWIRGDHRTGEVNVEIAWNVGSDPFSKRGKQPGPVFEAGVRFSREERADDDRNARPVVRVRPVERRLPNQTRILTPVRGPWEPSNRGWFAAGYGPMRRLSGASSDSLRFSMGGGVITRFVTLFREDAALSESEVWLRTNHSRSLEEKPELKQILDGVREMIGDGLLPNGMGIDRITVDHVYVRDATGVILPMRDVSDGCRGAYATVLDLVHSMAQVYGVDGLFSADADGKTVISRPGVVLIDEIEAHLHPAWQRDIPEWFKRHFPKIQFFVATHSPLVAQAADEEGAFWLPSPGDSGANPRKLAHDETARLRLGQADRTLLGVAFGLDTVRSHWANSRIASWRRLNAKARSASLARGEQEKLDELRGQMLIAFDSMEEQP